MTISDCHFDTDDDGITLKSTGSAPTEDVVITNCTVSSFCNAIKAGTESSGGFRNITISNCVITPSRNQGKPIFGTPAGGITGISLIIVDGGIMENITIDNIVIDGPAAPIYIRLGNRARKYTEGIDTPGIGKVRNIAISNVVARSHGNYGSSITGLPGHYVENISLSNIQLFSKGNITANDFRIKVSEDERGYPQPTAWGNLPAFGLFLRHVRGITLNGVMMGVEEPDVRSPVWVDDVQQLSIKQTRLSGPIGKGPFVKGVGLTDYEIEPPLGWKGKADELIQILDPSQLEDIIRSGLSDVQMLDSVPTLSFNDDEYHRRGYRWCGKKPFEFVLPVKENEDHVLGLLWAHKNEQRGGIVTVNGRKHEIVREAEDGWEWITLPVPAHNITDSLVKVRIDPHPSTPRHAMISQAKLNQAKAIELPENLPFVMERPIKPSFLDQTFDIREYGARHGGKVKNTKAIAEAIAACHKSGGGKVLIPEGIWLTGPIHLKSNVNLHVAEGAEVHFSRNPDDYLPVVFTRWEGVECYNYSPLIYARDCSNIAITGKGVFDGQGNGWRSSQEWQGWEKRQDSTVEKLLDAEYNGVAVKDRVYGTKEAALRPQMIQLINCRGVLLEDYTSQNSPFWNNHLVYCDGVIVRNIRLLNPKDGPNTDGINIDSSRNVHIQSLFADVGDDAVCIKSGINEDGWRVGRKSENIVVENCHVKKGHGGIVFGSDTSGGVRNVYVRNCLYDGTLMGIRMKSRRGRGGGVENVWIENIKMKNIGSHAIILNMFYAPSLKFRSDTPPTFRDIHIKDVICEGAGSAVTFRGLPERPIENITLENVTMTANSGLNCSDAKNIKLTNVNITPKQGPVITLKNSRSIVIKGSTSPQGVETFLHVKGPNSNDIRLVDTDLSNAGKAIVKESDVSGNAVKVVE